MSSILDFSSLHIDKATVSQSGRLLKNGFISFQLTLSVITNHIKLYYTHRYDHFGHFEKGYHFTKW